MSTKQTTEFSEAQISDGEAYVRAVFRATGASVPPDDVVRARALEVLRVSPMIKVIKRGSPPDWMLEAMSP